MQLLGVESNEHWSETLVERMRKQFPATTEHLLTHGCLPTGWTPETEATLAVGAAAPSAMAA